ncbi:MAG: phenylalanine--tRNA ligase subunit alpha [Bdellovibrio sp. CG12_big_fil_rev_8_21_14_0_65_39_13]|nr:MAG: phenylalanine--tRNA ligase subunit alpha [Bdellovibrio sp. CG22_combo_CG10-13_8_21_14_all_39_27]PIQ57721.1 MAG: phenylalanine--tRNA ligase subunit alpha [Bdellovibrio sp. CG12_big_fil_rev_8_21_14_0_65_39_13]PIR36549.1 MAG: phenylalanine--tRNA ligase subunit alpha [Bdellovibrio sp. CG11_big_fil_rev_8_21_14_0_20_39_38]
MNMVSKLKEILSEYEGLVAKIDKEADLMNLKAQFLGKSGKVTEILKGLKDIGPDERREVGPLANEVKEKIAHLTDSRLAHLEKSAIDKQLSDERIDITLRDKTKYDQPRHGGYHPRTLIQQEIEDVFLSMGFEILDGPHIEDEFHNFEALNIPGDHPARDMQDTFWFHQEPNEHGKRHLLRTHTSTIQVRGMMAKKPPFRFIAPGIVFRCERTDASHEMVFTQLEGMMVGKDISVSNLIYFMKQLLTQIFKKEVEVRLRPGFFPFVEPGFELDIRCLICNGSGCSVCKQVGWVELLPCGMVHPNVLKSGGIDPNEWNGFAFGLGLDRLVMMKYGIDDIRHLQSGDLRFNSQFSTY